MTELFSTFTADTAPVYFPGAPFLTACALILVALSWFGWAVRGGEPAPSPERVDDAPG
jgi:hypothetical protein